MTKPPRGQVEGMGVTSLDVGLEIASEKNGAQERNSFIIMAMQPIMSPCKVLFSLLNTFTQS